MARTSTARAPSQPDLSKSRPQSAGVLNAEQGALETALPNFDRVIHERMRLGIVSALAVSESLTFNELKRLLRTSDGNLSVHARRLEEAEYVECRKTFEGRMPKTEYRLTVDGRKAFERYLDHMEALIQAMREH